MERITSRDKFIEFAKRMKVSYDWHEPDEQNLTAVVRGSIFDNTGAWPADPGRLSVFSEEIHVLFCGSEKNDEAFATVNLADLCAWASQSSEDSFIAKLNQLLTDAGNDYPQGLAGVRDVIAQRDGYIAIVEEINKDDVVKNLRRQLDEANAALSNIHLIIKKWSDK
jgi:hypothetical protein